MSMFRNALEKKLEKEREIDELKRKHKHELTDLRRQFDHDMKLEKLKKDEFVVEFKKEMQQKLVESDLLRNEAKAKLEIYEKLDTKEDANVIKSMLNKLIEALGKTKNIQIIK